MKGTADGQILVWNAAAQAWVNGAGAAYPDIDEFDTMRWAYLLSSISGSGMANEGTAGSEFDLTASNSSIFPDTTPPDVWDISVQNSLAGVSSKFLKYESANLVTSPDMSNGLTISGWVRLDGTASQDDRVLVKHTGTTWGGTFYGVAMMVLTGGLYRVVINGSGNQLIVNTPANADAFVLGAWSHIGCTIDSGQTTMKVYVNGKLSNSGSLTGNVVWGSGPWMMGGRIGSTSQNFDGLMFDWRVAETVRDDAWFRSMYTARHLPVAGII